MKLREEAGQPRFDLGGNFLIRSRRHWVDEDTLVLSVDAPSDEWRSFSQRSARPRYGEDVAALLAEAGPPLRHRRWTLVGTSEGSVSAFHAARMNPALAPRLILTASLMSPGATGRAFRRGLEFELGRSGACCGCTTRTIPAPTRPITRRGVRREVTLLSRRCPATAAPTAAEPAVRSAPCEARSAHGLGAVGVEVGAAETVLANGDAVRTQPSAAFKARTFHRFAA
jgi:pimeloyl-ACP methyl ester carboxylesterase